MVAMSHSMRSDARKCDTQRPLCTLEAREMLRFRALIYPRRPDMLLLRPQMEHSRRLPSDYLITLTARGLPLLAAQLRPLGELL